MSIRAIEAPRLLGLFLSLTLCVGACTRDPSAPSDDRAVDISAAKGATTTDMSVSSATPDSATQDTTLDVVINGAGFVSGTAANWALAGVQDSSQVRTNNTRYVSSRQLIANITISASAAPAKWDIVVTAAGKKGGIGTEAFTVKATGKPIPDATPDFFLSNDNAYLLRGDGLTSYLEGSASPYGGMSRYRQGECGVGNTIFNSPNTGSGDAILNTAYKLFPESSAAKGKGKDDGKPAKEQELSTVGVAFAYLMRGVHW